MAHLCGSSLMKPATWSSQCLSWSSLNSDSSPQKKQSLASLGVASTTPLIVVLFPGVRPFPGHRNGSVGAGGNAANGRQFQSRRRTNTRGGCMFPACQRPRGAACQRSTGCSGKNRTEGKALHAVCILANTLPQVPEGKSKRFSFHSRSNPWD